MTTRSFAASLSLNSVLIANSDCHFLCDLNKIVTYLLTIFFVEYGICITKLFIFLFFVREG